MSTKMTTARERYADVRARQVADQSRLAKRLQGCRGWLEGVRQRWACEGEAHASEPDAGFRQFRAAHYLRQLRLADQRVRLIERAIDSLPPASEGSARFGREFDHLSRLPGVAAIDVDERERIVVTTEPIEVSHHGRRHRLGRFRIAIEPDVPFTLVNLDMPFERMGSRVDHPHVKGGEPCLGSAEDDVARAVLTDDVPAQIQIALALLRSYNPSSTFADLTSWPEVRPSQRNAHDESIATPPGGSRE